MDDFTLAAPAAPPPGSSTISPCGLYRYDLVRDLGGVADPRRVLFVMLNPSTADAAAADPTMTRCRNYARYWDYDGMAIVNLFAFRATEPRLLKSAADPVGPDNDAAIRAWLARPVDVVCAWGTGGDFRGRDRAVLDLIAAAGRPALVLRLSKQGRPCHPLYLPARLRPVAWR